MRTLTTLVVAAVFTSGTMLGQDAREIAREMGADTTTSISPGTDRNGVHRDTEVLLESRQRVPDLLERAQESKGKKANKTEVKRLLRKRDSLLKDRKAAADTAVLADKRADAAKEKARNFAQMDQPSTMNEAAVRQKAERAWDSKKRKEVEQIDRALKEEKEKRSEVRLHAPTLVKPR